MSNLKLASAAPQQTEPQLTAGQRKLRKLRRNPKQFFTDSKAYVATRKTIYTTWAKLGSFALVIVASVLLVIYYSLIASPRYVSQVQFVVKQAGSNELPIAGLAAIGASSPSMRDALILQEYIQSPEMAQALNNAINLQQHYQQQEWDSLSRLSHDASFEDYLEYYQEHIAVHYDEMSEILNVEVQGFSPEYALAISQALLKISEQFINQLGEGMAKQQLSFAEQQVDRAYQQLKQQQVALLAFQNQHNLFNPEAQSGALLQAVSQLESQIITKQTELKSLQAYMHSDAAEIKAKQYELDALTAQLAQEQQKLVNQDDQALNQVNADYQELNLNSKLAADLYQSALASLEMVRSDAYKKLKHLLIIEQPRLAQQQKYPQRLYNISTWFVVLLLIYLVGRLIVAIIRDHRE